MRITTRENIGKLLHDVEQGEPTSIDNPEEQIRDMIENAVTQRASDIHLYYDPLDKISVTKFRIDGYLKAIKKFCIPDADLVYHQTLVNKIYGMSGLDPSQFQRIWDESFATSALKKTVSVRLSSMPQPEAASVVLRLIYPRHGDSAVPIQSLGFDADVTAVLTEVLRMPDGIVLVSGPTGSGKTNTLYSLLNEKKKEPVNIVSVEDPIEMRIPQIRQVEVSRARDITFASAVRSFLRHDPDVILIGEIRDPETAKEAIRASLTGHLVFSTIHTNSACGVIPRLIDLGISEEYIASTLRIVLSQRLVRALCPHCSEEAVPPEQYGAFVGKMFRPVGCKHCNNEGFKGRTVIWEMLVLTDAVKRAILQKKYVDEEYLINLGGSHPMREIAKRLIQRGVSTIDEISRFVTLTSRFSTDTSVSCAQPRPIGKVVD
jgi:type II secretory ATPase GspE/PulE/Tfp pilus assembly ATPase PilB-like protein